MKKAAIIGAGLGGISAGIMLAARGFEIDIYEKNSGPGGKASSISESGFRFDTGPSLITMPFVIEDLFKSAGENISEYLNIKPLDILCKYFFGDGTIINAFADQHMFADEIETKTSEKRENLFMFLDYCRNIYKLTSEVFLFNDLYSLKNYLNLKSVKTLFNIQKMDYSRTMDKAVRGYFTDEKVIQIFDRYATYNGSNPFEAPATLNIISDVEYNKGGYYIKGGMYELTKALYELSIRKRIIFYFNSKVSRILIENKKVNGVLVNGAEKRYDIVISNSDAAYTYKYLLNDKNSKNAKRYSQLEPSSSAIVFYWGVKIKSDLLIVHNILFSGDYKKEFEIMFKDKNICDDPTIYIYISSKFSKDDAPEGYENWFVMVNAPYNTNQNWDEILTGLKTNILNKINSFLEIDISNLIVFEKILTPADIETETLSNKGSIYGISSNTKMAAFMRQRNKSKEYKGLYFCGGSVHPGGGVPLVILSGKIAAELIIRKEL